MSLLRKLSIRSQLSIIALSITFVLLFIFCTSQFSNEMNALLKFNDKQMRVALSGSDSKTIGIQFESMGYDQAGVSKSEIDWNGNTYVASKEYLPELKGSIVDMIPKDALMRDMNAIRFSFIWIFVFGAVFVAVMFSIITSNILLKKNDSLAKELLDTNAVLSFMQLEKKKAELAYLRCQINPHFLYNTLEMIKGMAAVKGVLEIREAAALLGSIFHYSVKGGGNVPLNTELTIVESYLQIQKLRFGTRFSVKFDIDGLARNCHVPKMILQPIVENAVYHGLELNEKHGLLSISAYLDVYRDLIIVIEDDGVGMNQAQLERVQSTLSNSEPSGLLIGEGDNSIGFANVNVRIKLICGSDYGLDIASKEGEGTRVTVKLSTKGEFSNVL
ncbi:sensor histidine kinase [Bacillus sp. FJAT-28004]|uniref:sensor histidine kinase n=1 Tax=Bacillus sp. FJAT-28004 TaxID=1679165 RepID=UPI0006B59442|nr:histidine kinase [Bacillus sp. FJAT-28004]